MAKFTTVKSGYSPEEVDKYIALLETKLRDFKEKENAIQNAIVSAQIAGDSMREQARREAYDIKEDALRQLDDIRHSMQLIRQQSMDFQAEYDRLVQKYTSTIHISHKSALEEKFLALEDVFISLKNAHSRVNVEKKLEQATSTIQEVNE